MTRPFCEIICSPDASSKIGLKRSGWILSKSGLGFENWVLRQEPKRKTVLDLKNRPDVFSLRFHHKRKPCPCVAKRDRLILKMLKAFEGLGNDGMARIDSRLWHAYFRRKVRRLGIGVEKKSKIVLARSRNRD